MEHMNQEIMKMIVELGSIRSQQKAQAAKIGERDQYGFPFEPGDSFSMEPLGFLETAMKLQTEAAESFGLLREYNRHSPLFYKMAARLEKLLSRLGSACITKAVIEQQGENSKDMDQLLFDLNIESLRQSTAFVFRKCYSSFMESAGCFRFNQSALDLSIRFSALDKRLMATAEKIELIKAGKVKIDMNDRSAGDKSDAAQKPEDQQENRSAAALASKGRAFPVDKSALCGTAEPVSGIKPEPISEQTVEPVASDIEVSASGSAGDAASEKISEPELTQEPGSSSAESEMSLAEAEDAFETRDEIDDFDEDTYFDEDEDLPVVSEDLVRRMSELCRNPEAMAWAFPEYAMAPP
jgi:hypothetical protein